MKKAFLLFMFIGLVVGFCFATTVETGNLRGKVFEPESMGLLPNVAVKIESPAMMVPMERLTNQEGVFRFSSIPIGKYTVTFKIDGFKTLVRRGILVNSQANTTLDVILEASPIEETVEVTGKSPTVDKQRVTAMATLDSEFLKQIPATRDVTTFFNMLPGITGDTAHGSSVRDNTYNLDGVNLSDPVVGTQAGSFSMDIVEEFAVQTGGITAEQGSVRGAVINMVTKSGGSKFSGMASFYYRDKSLQSDNTKGTIFEGQQGGFDYEMEPGINIGGPLVQNKIWFFTNLSFKKLNEYVNGYPYDTQPTNTPIDRLYLYPFIKFTIQPNADNKLILSYNYSDFRRNHRGASYQYTEESTWKQTTPVQTFNLQWTRFFGNDFYMNVKGAAMLYELNLMAKNDLPSYYDTTIRKYSKSYGYDDLYTRNRYQFLVDGTRFVDDFAGGNHEIKAGIEVEYSNDSRYRRHNVDPTTGLGPFIYTRNNGQPYYATFYQDFTRKDAKLAIGAYLQDSWSLLNDRLTLNLGVRYDHQEGIIPKQGMERTPVEYGGEIYDPRVTKAFKPIKWDTFAPRIGLNFDISGDGKTVFKASFGRYYVANILQWFVTANPNSFISWRYRLNPDWTLQGDRYNFSATSSTQIDPNIESPYLDELNIGIERELFKDVKMGIRYIKKWDRKLLEDVDLNALNFDALMRGDDIFTVWTNFTPVTVTDPYDGKTVTFYDMIDPYLASAYMVTNPPGAQRDYDGVEVTLEKRFSNKWSMSASYVYSKSTGLIGTDFDDSWSGQPYFDNPNWHINALGDFNLERRNQFKLQALFQAPFGINISGYYSLLGGRRYQREIRSIDLGLDLWQGTEQNYAEKRGSRKYPDLSVLDLRLEKTFKLGNFRLALFADIFNIFNINTAINLYEISSTTTLINNKPVKFGEAEEIYAPPRVFRLGARIEF